MSLIKMPPAGREPSAWSDADMDAILALADRERDVRRLREQRCRRLIRDIDRGVDIKVDATVRIERNEIGGVEETRLYVRGFLVHREVSGGLHRITYMEES